MVWQFQNTGCRTGAFNMMYDERLAQSLVPSNGPFVLRVYGWNPPALSLGWHQDIEEIDLKRCAEAGVDVVRRPTGGRAILHSQEVTYSVVMRATQTSVLAIYQYISNALVYGLRKLGVDAALEKSQPHFPSLYRSSSGMACFASAARYEIHVGGRKLVGSAQRRFARPNGEQVVLQHGSILLGDDHLRIVEFLKGMEDAQRRKLRSELEEKTIDLSTALGRPVGFDEVVAALREGFEAVWQVHFLEVGFEEESANQDEAPGEGERR